MSVSLKFNISILNDHIMEVPTVTIKRKKSKSLGSVIYSGIVIFYLLKYFFTTTHFVYGENPFMPAFRLILLGFMGLLMTAHAYQAVKELLKKGPALVLNSDGIIDNVSPANAGLMRWENISHVDIQKVSWKKSMIIHLIDDQAILDKLKGVKKVQAEGLKKKTGSSIASTLTVWFQESPNGGHMGLFWGSAAVSLARITTKVRIEDDSKLDYKDVLIRPKRSTLGSRKDVDLEREFTFRNYQASGDEHYRGIPIMASNMDGVGTFTMADTLAELGLFTCLVKNYSAEELTGFFARGHCCATRKRGLFDRDNPTGFRKIPGGLPANGHHLKYVASMSPTATPNVFPNSSSNCGRLPGHRHHRR